MRNAVAARENGLCACTVTWLLATITRERRDHVLSMFMMEWTLHDRGPSPHHERVRMML
jgi:hypothetical protein